MNENAVLSLSKMLKTAFLYSKGQTEWAPRLRKNAFNYDLGGKVKRIIYLGMVLMLFVSCVGTVQLTKMNLDVEKKQPLILNLKNAGTVDSNIDFFMQSERLVKGSLLQMSGDEWGYYDVTYRLNRDDRTGFLEYTVGTTLGAWALLGLPTWVTHFDLYTDLYIFDSNGNLVREYHNRDKLTHVAGLYYGYKPTKRIAKRFSKLYEKMFELAWLQGNEINKSLKKAGKVTDEKDEAARQKIKEFYENKKPEAQPEAFREGVYSRTGTDFTLSLLNGTATLSENGVTIATGTYKINKNQLAITYPQGDVHMKHSNGITYTYAITNYNEFTLGDEKWKYIE
ncbi:MAG: hypothetical protein ACTTKL_10065 [Treponema sp.]